MITAALEASMTFGAHSPSRARPLPGWLPSASIIHAVHPGNRRMSAKVRAFVDHLARHFGHSPCWDRGP